MKTNPGAHQRREQLRRTHFNVDDVWLGGKREVGWFSAPRTLPLILELIDTKAVSGPHRPSRTYLELFSRHRSEGLIEMKHEGQHAYAAGQGSNRGTRTWRDHMRILEQNGFIKTVPLGAQEFGYVLLIHPTTVVEHLRKAGKITDSRWLTAYKDIQVDSKEPTFEERAKAKAAMKKVIHIKTTTAKQP